MPNTHSEAQAVDPVGFSMANVPRKTAPRSRIAMCFSTPVNNEPFFRTQTGQLLAAFAAGGAGLS